MPGLPIEIEKPSLWQRVFLHSKVNGAPYCGEQLPSVRWNWAKDTFLQRRLKEARAHAGADKHESN